METATPAPTIPVVETQETATLAPITQASRTLQTTIPGTAIPETGMLETATLAPTIPGIGTNHPTIRAVSIQKNQKFCCSINRQI